MRRCAVLLAFIPIIAYPSESLIIPLSEPYVEFNDVAVWYFKEIDANSTQVLANGIAFRLFMSVQRVSSIFPKEMFVSGYILNKTNGKQQTNYVFIRKDKVESIHRHRKGASITLKTFINGYSAEKIQLAYLNKEQ
ncbi:MAG: hypothetical protein ACRC9L_00300 [Brevinema sp.]